MLAKLTRWRRHVLCKIAARKQNNNNKIIITMIIKASKYIAQSDMRWAIIKMMKRNDNALDFTSLWHTFETILGKYAEIVVFGALWKFPTSQQAMRRQPN